MSSPTPVAPCPLAGFKYFDRLGGLPDRLRPAGTARDKAGNRQLFLDQYARLLLLYSFNPAATTLRGVQPFTTPDKVRRLPGVRPTARGSLSEAARVVDPALLEPVVAELAGRARARPDARPPAERAARAGLVAVDGSLPPALPRMARAPWQDAAHRAAKVHVAFAVRPGVPIRATVTAGSAPERDELRRAARPGEFHVLDRGYAEYDRCRELDAAGCRFVQRVQDNAAVEVASENPPADPDRAAGVVRDVVLRRPGTGKHHRLRDRPLRLVEARGERPEDRRVLVTNALALPADLAVAAYRYRWQVERYFRWLRCILGCRHRLAENRAGVTVQVDRAVIASLLIGRWAGAKPTERTYEMFCHDLSGWATAEEVEHHPKTLQPKTGPPSKP